MVVNVSLYRKPVQLSQNRRDMVASSGSSQKPSSGVLDGLNSSDKIVGHTIEQRVAITQATGYEHLDKCSGCFVC